MAVTKTEVVSVRVPPDVKAALVAAAEQYGLPIHAIGVGEKLDDLRPFDPDLVARLCTSKVRVVDYLSLDAQSSYPGLTDGPTSWGGEVRSELMAVDCHLLAPP